MTIMIKQYMPATIDWPLLLFLTTAGLIGWKVDQKQVTSFWDLPLANEFYQVFMWYQAGLSSLINCIDSVTFNG